jgi:hypothetical protein
MASRNEGEADMNEGNEERNRIRLWLGFGFVVSILLLVVLHEPLHSVWWGQLVLKLLDAVAIASVIGFVLEEALLREFGREVFLASVGYVLPRQLRPEMRWLCQLNEMCISDVMTCSLTPLGSSVKFHVHRTQVVKNIGQSTHELKVGLGIDQWFRPEEESRILKFSFVTEGQSWAYKGKPGKFDYGLNLGDGVPVVSLEKARKLRL